MTDAEKLAAVRELVRKWREDEADTYSYEHQGYYAHEIELAIGETE